MPTNTQTSFYHGFREHSQTRSNERDKNLPMAVSFNLYYVITNNGYGDRNGDSLCIFRQIFLKSQLKTGKFSQTKR